MQLIVTIVPLLLSSLATAVPLGKRSTATILSDISTISGYVTTLQSDAASYTGSLLQSLSLVVTVDNLESALTSATSAVTSSSAFDTADSTSITSAVSTLEPKVVALLTALDGISSTIASAGYTSTVLSALKTIKTDTDDLFVALQAKATTSDAATLTTLQSDVDSAFTTGESTF